MFDEFLRRRAETTGEPYVPFDDEDYVRDVDGRSRYDGVAGFLASRGHPAAPRRAERPARSRHGLRAGEPQERRIQRPGPRARRRGVRVDPRPCSQAARSWHPHGGRLGERELCRRYSPRRRRRVFEVRVDGLDAAEPSDWSASPTRRCFSRRRVASVSSPGGPRSWRTRSPAWRPAGAAASGSSSASIALATPTSSRPMVPTSSSPISRASTSTTEGGGALPRPVRSTATLPAAVGNPELRARLAGRRARSSSTTTAPLHRSSPGPSSALLADETLTVLDRLADLCLVAVISGRDLDDCAAGARPAVWFAGSHGFDIVDTRRRTSRGRASAAAARGARRRGRRARSRADRRARCVGRAKARSPSRSTMRQVDDTLVPDVEDAVDRALDAAPRIASHRRQADLRAASRRRVGQGPGLVVPPGAGRARARHGRADLHRRRRHRRGRVLGARRRRGWHRRHRRRRRPTRRRLPRPDPDEVRAFLRELVRRSRRTGP